jgi:hypothetical protein
MALLEGVAAQHCGNALGMRAHAAVTLLQSQLSASQFQAVEGTGRDAAANAEVEAAEGTSAASSSSTPPQPETPVARKAAPADDVAAAAAAPVAEVALPSAAAFAASFAAAFAGAEPVQQAQLKGSDVAAVLQAKERRSTKPEATAGTCCGSSCRMVTFDIPTAAGTPQELSTEASTTSVAITKEAAAASVNADKAAQSSNKNTAVAAKKPAAPTPAPHSQAAGKLRAQRAVAKQAGVSPRGLKPGKPEQAAQQQAKAAGMGVTVGRVSFPA